ncbi:MAG: choice-of-anchor R domain-containing protein [bacterium]
MQIKNQKSKIKNIFSGGYVMLLTAVIFMMVSLVIVFGLTTPIVKQILISRDVWNAKQSYYLSEAGAEDVMYRLKDSNYASKVGESETLTLDGYSAVTAIGPMGEERIITTLSDQNGYKKTIQTKVIQGVGTSFNYGILTGEGSFVITGGSEVVGNIYSNGNILGGSGVHITGSAIAASGGSIFKDQTNETPSAPPNSLTFNNTKDTRDFAQSFQPGTTSKIQRIRVYIKKTNFPGNFIVDLTSDSSGNPGSVLTSGTLFASQVTTNYGWVDLTFAQNITLNINTTYWLVIKGTTNNNSSDTYTIAANNLYTRGVAKIGKTGGTWNSTNLDGYFSLYLGATPSKILGNEGNYFYIGSTSTDIAWASDVSHVNITGTLYCETGTNNANGKTCNTSRGLPDTMPMPVSEANIDQWKTEAIAGGTYSGNFNVDWDGDILGPRKITGNLTVNGGGTLMITGTVWVQGYIVVTGGGKIKISPSLGGNSAIILSDKYVNVDGGAQFEGSGTAGSYPVVVSTSICPNATPCATNNSAISLSGGSGAVVLTAPYGKVNINGGSGARSVCGDSIYISGGGSVTYETGLANLSFSSGPSGGWNISGWKELEN